MWLLWSLLVAVLRTILHIEVFISIFIIDGLIFWREKWESSMEQIGKFLKKSNQLFCCFFMLSKTYFLSYDYISGKVCWRKRSFSPMSFCILLPPKFFDDVRATRARTRNMQTLMSASFLFLKMTWKRFVFVNTFALIFRKFTYQLSTSGGG